MTSPSKWTHALSRAANKEGWDIFDADGPGGELQVQRLDEENLLDDDSDAWLLVRTGTGEHHRVAREIIAAKSPAEWKRINDWYAQHHPQPT